MKIGQRVIDRWGHAGTIDKHYDDFSACAASCLTMTGEQWLAAQERPFTPEQLAEPWFGVKLDIGGAIWSPMSDLTPEARTP